MSVQQPEQHSSWPNKARSPVTTRYCAGDARKGLAQSRGSVGASRLGFADDAGNLLLLDGFLNPGTFLAIYPVGPASAARKKLDECIGLFSPIRQRGAASRSASIQFSKLVPDRLKRPFVLESSLPTKLPGPTPVPNPATLLHRSS